MGPQGTYLELTSLQSFSLFMMESEAHVTWAEHSVCSAACLSSRPRCKGVTATQARPYRDAINIYLIAIMATRGITNGLPGKQRLEMGNKWVACLCWQLRGAVLLIRAARLKAATCTCAERSVRALTDSHCCLQTTVEVRLGSLSVGHRPNPQGQYLNRTNLHPRITLLLHKCRK